MHGEPRRAARGRPCAIRDEAKVRSQEECVHGLVQVSETLLPLLRRRSLNMERFMYMGMRWGWIVGLASTVLVEGVAFAQATPAPDTPPAAATAAPGTPPAPGASTAPTT